MSTQLINIVQFAGLVVGVPVAQAHNLNQDDRALVPDVVLPDLGGFTIAADAVNVTVTRPSAAVADSVDVCVFQWHTILRNFGPTNPPPGFALNGSLTPQPFIVAPGVNNLGGACYNVTAVNGTLFPTFNDLCRIDPTASGGVIVTLPLMAAASEGCPVIVKNSSDDSTPITIVTPGGGQTIDGGLSAVIAAARGSLEFRADGVSNWEIV
jgi:hypothetical protein